VSPHVTDQADMSCTLSPADCVLEIIVRQNFCDFDFRIVAWLAYLRFYEPQNIWGGSRLRTVDLQPHLSHSKLFPVHFIELLSERFKVSLFVATFNRLYFIVLCCNTNN